MTKHKDKLKLCFVAPYSYSLFDETTHYPFGGIEVQAHLLATGLARRPEFEINFIVFDHGQPQHQVIDGVNVIAYRETNLVIRKAASKFRRLLGKVYRFCFGANHEEETDDSSYIPSSYEDREYRGGKYRNTGRVFRLRNRVATFWIYVLIMSVQKMVDVTYFIIKSIQKTHFHMYWIYLSHPRLSFIKLLQLGRSNISSIISECPDYFQNGDFIRVYKNVNADVYIGFGVSELMAELAAFSRFYGKKLVLLASSNSDFQSNYYYRSKIRNYYGCLGDRCHYAIMRAHSLVAQNVEQQNQIQDVFLRKARIILNPINLNLPSAQGKPWNERRYFLWIGKADEVKNPAVFVNLAKALPSIPFYMVLNASHTEIELCIRAGAPDNLVIVQKAARKDVPTLMSKAYALVNTSRFEGFPNALLEACRSGAPIISLHINPSEFLTKHECGIYTDGNFEKLAESCKQLFENEGAWSALSMNAEKYVSENHASEKILDELSEVIYETYHRRNERLISRS